MAEGECCNDRASFFWHLRLSVSSFLGKPCPAGRSGGRRGPGSRAECTDNSCTMEQRWRTEKTPPPPHTHTPSMLRSPALSLGLTHAACSSLISSYCITKGSPCPPPSTTHHNAGIIFMNERARWSVTSLHPHRRPPYAL